MTKDKIIETLIFLKNTVRQNYKANIKGVFGSYVRGEEKKESDIDVLVEFSQGADLFDFIGLGQFLEENLKHKVDIVPENDIRKELRDVILKEVIYL